VGRSENPFYAEKPRHRSPSSPELDLAGAASLAGLAEEIKLLRALIKCAIQEGQVGEARRLLLALCGALRLEQSLAGQPVGDSGRLLDELLDEVGLEPALASPASPVAEPSREAGQ
jgi:hypothetical protein